MPETPQPQQQGEQFKAKIEQGIDRGLPAEQINNLNEELKAETEKNNAMKSNIRNLVKTAFNAERTADLAISSEEKQNIFNDVKNQLTRQFAGNEQVTNAIMQSYGINTAERLMSRIGLRTIEEQKLYEKFNNFLQEKPGYIFGFAKQIKDSPWTPDMMIKAAEKSPENAFFYFKEYSDMPEETVKKILSISAEKQPELAFKYIDNYKDMKGAEDIVKMAAEKMQKPEDALKYISKISSLKNAKNIMIAIINKMPATDEIFNNMKDIVSMDGAADIINLAVLKAKDKEIVFRTIDQYKTIKNASAVLIMALPFLKNKNDAFYKISNYSEIPNADSVLINALMMGAEASSAFSWITDYINMPNARGVLALAASQSPKSAYEQFNLYKTLPNKGANEVIKAAISANPDLTFDKIGILKGISPEMVRFAVSNAVKNKPEDAFTKLEAYKDLPKGSVDAILLTAAELNPAAAILNYEKYNDQAILKVAAENIRPMDLFNQNVIKTLQTKLENSPFKTNLLAKFAEQTKDCRALGENILKHEGASVKSIARDNTVEAFFQDPALQSILKVNPSWITMPRIPWAQMGKLPPININNARIIIARNLHFQKITPTEASVKKEWQTILEHRERYSNLALFKERNVVMMAENQSNQGVQIFGREALRNSIKNQGSKALDVIQTENQERGENWLEAGLNEIRNKKNQLIAKIVNTPPPLTFYHSGHSGPHSLGIDRNFENFARRNNANMKEIFKETSISDRQFAEMLSLRNQKWPDEYKNMDTRPILVFSGCHGSEFLRNVYAHLTNKHPLPISVAAAEYSAMATMEAKNIELLRDPNALPNEFEDKVLSLDPRGNKPPTTVGTVFSNEKSTTYNNPVIYIPSHEGDQRQA